MKYLLLILSGLIISQAAYADTAIITRTNVVEATPAIETSAYAAGDLIGELLTLSNAAANGVVAFGIDYDEGFATTNTAGTGSSKNSTMRNSILSIVNSGTSTRMRLNLTNSATKLKNNRFFDVDQNAGFEGGYDLGTSQSTLSSAYDLTSQAALLGAGNTDIVVSHDINGKRRNSFPPDIGPVDF